MQGLGRPSRLDVGLAAALVALQLTGLGDYPDLDPAAWVLGLVLPVALVLRRLAPLVPPVAYLSACVCAALLDQPQPSSTSTVIGLVIGVYSVGAFLPLPRAAFGLALWWASALPDLMTDRHDATDWTFAFAVMACAWVPGVVSRKLRADVATGRAEAARVRDEQELRAAQAVSAERMRIARELHDVVAHAVSMMVVQAAAADRVLDRDPQRAHEALGAVQDAGRSAVAELARMLGLLRGESAENLRPLPTLGQLPDLVSDTGRSGAARVELVREGDLSGLPPVVEICAYRVVQEGLTNAIKHALDPTVHIEVRRRLGSLQVCVEDDGGSGPRTSSGTAHGLAGLRERVAMFGGALDAGPRPDGGYRVAATIPLTPGLT
jgi:signal transduction histidine kinase